jgi:hypothetical protein
MYCSGWLKPGALVGPVAAPRMFSAAAGPKLHAIRRSAAAPARNPVAPLSVMIFLP